jgi:hypothetical protein
VPGVPLAVAVPFDPPQVADVLTMVTVGTVPLLVRVTLTVSAQPLFVIVNVYVPGARLKIESVEAPVDHKYVTAPTLPVTVVLTLPLLKPQVGLVGVAVAVRLQTISFKEGRITAARIKPAPNVSNRSQLPPL